jgi:hypothetical protein
MRYPHGTKECAGGPCIMDNPNANFFSDFLKINVRCGFSVAINIPRYRPMGECGYPFMSSANVCHAGLFAPTPDNLQRFYPFFVT